MSTSTLAPATTAVQHPGWCEEDVTFPDAVFHRRFAPAVVGETGERVSLSLNRDDDGHETGEDYITVFVGPRYGPARETVQLSRAAALSLFASGLGLLARSETEQ